MGKFIPLKTNKIANSAFQFEVEGFKVLASQFSLSALACQNSRLLGSDNKILVCQLEKTYAEKENRDLEEVSIKVDKPNRCLLAFTQKSINVCGLEMK